MHKTLKQIQLFPVNSFWKQAKMPVGIFGVAFAIHLIHLGMAGWGEDLQSAYPRSDAYIYLYQAWFTAFIDTGGGFAGEFMSPSPYVWLQTAAYKVFGPHYIVPLLVNIILVSFTAVFSALTTRRLFGEQTGWIAGMMLALAGPVVFFAGITVKTNLVLFLLAMACYLVIRFFQQTRFWWAFAAIFVLGLAAMERQNLLLLVILAMVLIVLHGWRTASKKELIPIGVAGLAAISLLFIISGWNPSEVEPKMFSPVGLNFYVGNSPGSWGGYTIVEGIHDDIIGHRTEPQQFIENKSGRSLSRWGVSQYWFKKSFDYYVSHPQEYAILQLRKAGLLVAQYSQGVPEQYHVWRWERPALIIAFIDTGLMLILSGFGLYYLRSRLREPGVAFLISGSILYALSVWIFFVAERYRLSLIILLVPVAAYGVWNIFSHRSGKQIALSIALVLGLYGGTWMLNGLIPYGPGWAKDRDRFLAEEVQRLEKEKRYYQLMRQLVDNPGLEAWVELSSLLERRGFFPDAKTFARRAIALTPNRAMGYERMLDLLDQHSTKSERDEFAAMLARASGNNDKENRIFKALKRQLPRLRDGGIFRDNDPGKIQREN